MIGLLLSTLLTSPPVDLTPIDGAGASGELQSLTADSVVINVSGKAIRTPLDSVLRLDFRRPSAAASRIRLRTIDGSRFGCQSFETDGRDAAFALEDGERRSLPIERISAALLSDDPHEAADWIGKSTASRKSDLLVFAREGKRLSLEGTINSIGPEKLLFTFEGDDLPIRRERVRALYFAQRGQAISKKSLAVATDVRGNAWAVRDWRWADGLSLETPAGLSIQIPEAQVASLDFAAGRLSYLSDLEPTAVQHTPYFDVPWNYRRDQNFHGGPLIANGKRFAKGLAVHSKTMLEYELGGNYRTFLTAVAVEDSGGPRGDAEVRILVDGKRAWEARVRAGEPIRQVSLKIPGAGRLVLEVDYGKGLDLGDHIVFGDARVVQ
jgi:hypothetical protein